MSYLPLTSTDELQDRIEGTLDLGRAAAALRDASALVRSAAGKSWIDDNGDLTDPPDEIVTVVLQVARRAYENPRGVQQESTGPFSASFGGHPGGGAWLTDQERAVCEKFRASSGVWTLATTRSGGSESTEWWDGGYGPGSPTRGPW